MPQCLRAFFSWLLPGEKKKILIKISPTVIVNLYRDCLIGPSLDKNVTILHKSKHF